MLAASVDSFKWFFTEQAGKTMFICYFLHDLHSQLVVVNCHIGGIKDRRQLMLRRSYFVVFCLCGDSQLPKLFIQVVHISCNSWFQSAEVMIFHFLSSWRGGSH